MSCCLELHRPRPCRHPALHTAVMGWLAGPTVCSDDTRTVRQASRINARCVRSPPGSRVWVAASGIRKGCASCVPSPQWSLRSGVLPADRQPPPPHGKPWTSGEQTNEPKIYIYASSRQVLQQNPRPPAVLPNHINRVNQNQVINSFSNVPEPPIPPLGVLGVSSVSSSLKFLSQ